MEEVVKYILCCVFCLFLGRWAIAEISLFIPEFEQGIKFVDDLAHEMTHDKWMPVLTGSTGEEKGSGNTEAAEAAHTFMRRVKKSAHETAKEMGIEIPQLEVESTPNPTGLQKEQVIDHF